MSKDILEGANFHRENNVTVWMAKNVISIGDECTVRVTSSMALEEDKLDNGYRLAAHKASVVPEELIRVSVPGAAAT